MLNSRLQNNPPGANPNGTIAVTALPNGWSGNSLKLTLLFTLSIANGKSMADAGFDHWASPSNALANLLRTGQWTFAFTDKANKPVHSGQFTVAPKPYPLRVDMWNLLFQGSAGNANTDRKNTQTKTPWHIAHDAAFTECAIKNHRLIRARIQFAQRQRKSDFLTNLAALDGQFASIDVYLHPSLGNTSGISMKDQLHVRQWMLDPTNTTVYVPTLMSPTLDRTNIQLLQDRFNWCRGLLDSVDQPLAPLGLFACWRHCAVSLPIGSDLKDRLTDIIETAAQNSACNLSPDGVRQAQSNVEFLLNSRKKQPKESNCTAAPPLPDFHQMLGMVNRYPALLRPLGLAVDVKLDSPTDFDYPSARVLAVTPPVQTADTVCFQTAVYIGRTGGMGPLEFCARSNYEEQIAKPTDPKNIDDAFRLLRNRYLWLQATSNQPNNQVDAAALFYTTSQDSTGMLNKMQNASFAYQRGSQYRQYPTGADAVKRAPDTVPSARTMGIQLFHVARVARSQQAATDPPCSTTPRVLYADDLILGYRVDMHDGRSNPKWFPLCGRTSTYQSQDQSVTWTPVTAEDLVADEGFVTLGGLVEDTDDGSSTLIHMHQGIFTWNGENLSVKPFFDTDPNTPANPVFPLIPRYDIVGNHSELPLRFEKVYSIRCRMVDLAGNSPSCGEFLPGDASEITLLHKFLREEPYRGPQILLRESIQRDEHPGEDIATLVLRDGDGYVERAVVPPRETRHLGEWAGKLDSGLSRGAFEDFWLDPETGRFITVQELDEGLPLPPDRIDSERQDGILCLNATTPRDRYFPDPHILYACIQFNPLGDTTQWKDASVKYLRFYKDNTYWPYASPVLLRLLSTDDQPYASVDYSRLFPSNVFADTPILEFYLPKAMDAIVELSSAAQAGNNLQENPVQLAITQPTARVPASANGNKQSATKSDTTVQPMLVASNVNDTGPTPNQSLLKTVLTARPVSEDLSWNNGTNPATSPVHQIRLVHAVKQPLRQPTVEGLALTRDYGATIGCVHGTLDPDIASTGKVMFHASYELVIDDPARPEPYRASYNEVAFEVDLPAARPGQTRSQSDDLKQKKHVFHDNRARSITYSTVSTSKFLGFYADAASHQSRFEITQILMPPVQLKATVRPPAPVVSYIIPAFRWKETTVSGQYTKTRHPYLRVYVERPFKVTDNDQMLAAILMPMPRSADPKAASWPPVEMLVSKIGLDPLQGSWSQRGFTQVEMNTGMFANNKTADTSFLVECADDYKKDPSVTGAVDVLPFETNFADNRNLWFADIAISPMQSGNGGDFQLRSPFVQLALASYAPNGLQGKSPLDDARISAVVLADFMQLAEDRCCAIVRNGNTITLCISGPFVSNGVAPTTNSWNAARKRWEWIRETRISVELQHRWHSVEEEVSWLPIDLGEENKFKFEFVPDDAHGLGTLKISFALPHSPNWFKYAVLVMEEETLPGKDGSSSYRSRYFDQIEI